MKPIEAARAAAAKHLDDQGFVEEAAMVAAGEGDDFAEVRIALSLWEIMNADSAISAPRFRRRAAGEEC